MYNQPYAQPQPAAYLDGEWLTSKEGLSQGMIGSIIQDKEGYMWFATKDGLNKYDGYKITVYRHNPDDPYSLPDNYVTYLCEDDNGNFWVTTLSKGLYLFEKSTERFYPFHFNSADSASDNILYGLWFRKGKMFVQKVNDLQAWDISHLHPGSYPQNGVHLSPVFSYNQVQKNTSFKINPFTKPVVVLVNAAHVLIRFDDTVLQAVQPAGSNAWLLKGLPASVFSISNKKLTALYFDPFPLQQDKLYYGLGHKIFRLNLQTLISSPVVDIKEEKGHTCLKIQSLPDGTIYFFFNKSWLYNTNTGELKNVPIQREQEDFTPMYTTFCFDSTGNVWYGTGGYGAFRADRTKPPFRAYKTADNLQALQLVHGKNWSSYQQYLRNKVFADFQNVACDANGNFWFGNYVKGALLQPVLVRYDPVQRNMQQFNLLQKSNLLRTVFFRDKQDSLWVFSEEGVNKKMLYRFNSATGAATITAQFPVYEKDDNQYAFLSAWQEDVNGFFWFATVQGLFRYDVKNNAWKQWKNMPGNTQSLPSDMLLTICFDPKAPAQYLWVGTNGAGFCRFNMATGQCLRFSDKDGLPNNVVYGMLTDDLGNLWMSTNKGISCFNTQNSMFRNFSRDDNLPCDEFNRNQYAKLPGGALLFGGVGGYVVFNPADILKARKAVPIVFTGLSISNKPVEWKKNSDVITAPVGYAKQVTLHPGQNMFTISFASLDYRNNEKKFYKYRLDGFDEDWTNPSNKNEATYTNLSPGSYLLHVTGTNTDGVWNEQGISIPVIVFPNWYQTTWFKIMVALLITGAIYAWYRYRLQQHLQLLNVRNRIAGDLHDEIGSTLSSISLSSTIIQNKLKDETPEVQHLLQQISTNTDTMMEAMSDIVWAINTRNDNFESVINRMRAFAVEMLEPQGVSIHFSIIEAALHQNLDMVQRKNCYLLFKEAINNAAKYAYGKNVWVTIDVHGGKASMEIKDDGKGFKYVKGNFKENSFGGNGLLNMYKRAAEIKGILKVESAPDKGTLIRLWFEV